jgi:hypothetical protein
VYRIPANTCIVFPLPFPCRILHSALIAQQKLRIAKLERQIYGQRSERSSRLIDQLALTFEELEASATEDELAAKRTVARTTTVRGFTRTRPEAVLATSRDDVRDPAIRQQASFLTIHC